MKQLSIAITVFTVLSLAAVGSAEAKTVYWRNYGGEPQIKPRRVDVYTRWITHTKHWRHWGAHRTRARGRVHYNTCRPSCGAGHYRTKPGRVTLRGIHKCGSRLQYRKAHLKFKHGPRLRSQTFEFKCDGSVDL